MLAARNRRFRIAAALAGVAWLLLAALELIDVIHLFQETVRGGYDAAAVLFFGSHLVGAFGWFIVASAFGAEIEWGQLRTGATVVATTYLVYFVAWMCRTVAVFADTHNSDYRGYYIAGAIGALTFVVGVCVAATGFGERRRGESRASRLQVGASLIAAASVAIAIGELSLQSFYSATGAVHEATIGTLLVAVGTFLTAAAVLVFAAGARRPLAVRERAVVGASAVGVIATICIVVGEGLIAVAYSRYGAPDWEQAVTWLGVASRLVLVATFIAIALGARSARDDSTLGVTGAT
jgi:hypothetical protein